MEESGPVNPAKRRTGRNRARLIPRGEGQGRPTRARLHPGAGGGYPGPVTPRSRKRLQGGGSPGCPEVQGGVPWWWYTLPWYTARYHTLGTPLLHHRQHTCTRRTTGAGLTAAVTRTLPEVTVSGAPVTARPPASLLDQLFKAGKPDRARVAQSCSSWYTGGHERCHGLNAESAVLSPLLRTR